MTPLNYTSIELLSIWLSPSPDEIVKTIKDKFEECSNTTVYFVDATSSFPLREFRSAIPLDNKHVYDNIRITACLDLQEVMQIVNKIIQQLTMNGHRRQNSEKEPHKPIEVLLLINGLNVMFQNTQITNSASASHLLLRDILLKLRLVANNPQSDGSRLKSAMIFPREDITRYTSGHGNDNSNKRLKNIVFEGNTLAQYIARFYADLVI